MNRFVVPLVLAAGLLAGCGKNETSAPASSSGAVPVPVVATPAPAGPVNPAPAPLPTKPAEPIVAAVPSAPAPVTISLSSAPTTAAGGAKAETQRLAERPDVKSALESINATLKDIRADRAAREAKAAAPAGAPKAAPAIALGELSGDTVTRGLKEALGKGLERALTQLGSEGGFLTNLAVRIPMPEQLASADKLLHKLGQEKLADEFIASMNRAAEQAVPAAAETFAGALKQMSIQDAQQILQGPDDAATQFFRRTTDAQLREKFRPLVEQATAKAGVTAAYKRVADKAAPALALSSAFAKQDALDVDGYVTGKALDGLFKTVAEEEKRIRQNPVARTTDLLKSVFGGLKR